MDKVLERRAELPASSASSWWSKEKGLRSYPADLVLAFSALEARGRDCAGEHPKLIEDCLARQSLEDIGLMIYTSGSTGKPKGAMLSYRNLRAEAIAHSPTAWTRMRAHHPPLLSAALPRGREMLTTMQPIYLGAQVNFG